MTDARKAVLLKELSRGLLPLLLGGCITEEIPLLRGFGSEKKQNNPLHRSLRVNSIQDNAAAKTTPWGVLHNGAAALIFLLKPADMD